ncbi:MAG: glycosyltransferase family 2 protein [Actinomycetes bacterium]
MDAGSNPTVTIVVPAFGVERWIAGCVASIQRQEIDLEIIVVDDASPDDSATIARQLAERDSRLSVISNHRTKGVGGARNSGLEVARGHWVLFLDGDDELEPGALRTLVAAAEHYPEASAAFGRFISVDGDGRHLGGMWQGEQDRAFALMKDSVVTRNFIARGNAAPPPGGQLFLTTVAREINGYHEGTPVLRSEDFDFLMRALSMGPVVLVDAPVVRYLQRGDSRSKDDALRRKAYWTRLVAIRRSQRKDRIGLSLAVAARFGRLGLHRLREAARKRNLRSLRAAGTDAILMGLSILWGVGTLFLPAWKPDWPVLLEPKLEN